MGILDDNYDVRFKASSGGKRYDREWRFAQSSSKRRDAARKRQAEESSRRRRAAERRSSDDRRAAVRRRNAYNLRDEANVRRQTTLSGELPSWNPTTAAEMVEQRRQMQTQQYRAASKPYSNLDPQVVSRLEYMKSGGPGFYEDYAMRRQEQRDMRRQWTEQKRWEGWAEAFSEYQPIVLPPPIDEGYAGYGAGYSGGGYGGWPSYGGGSYKQAPRWMQQMVMWSIT